MKTLRLLISTLSRLPPQTANHVGRVRRDVFRADSRAGTRSPLITAVAIRRVSLRQLPAPCLPQAAQPLSLSTPASRGGAGWRRCGTSCPPSCPCGQTASTFSPLATGPSGPWTSISTCSPIAATCAQRSCTPSSRHIKRRYVSRRGCQIAIAAHLSSDTPGGWRGGDNAVLSALLFSLQLSVYLLAGPVMSLCLHH